MPLITHGAPKPEVITASSRKREYSRVAGPMNHCQPDINDENVPSATGIRRRARVIVITAASCEAKSGRFQITHMRFTLARLAILETCRRAQLRRRSHF